MRIRNCATVALMIALFVAVSGCGSVAQDTSLGDRLSQQLDDGQSPELRDLTEFDWDTVYVFFPYTPGSEIDDVSGADVVDRGLRLGEFQDLLVFMFETKPVRIAFLGDVLNPTTDHKWASDVTLANTRYCGFVLTDAGHQAIPDGCT